jgi:hypothetical protein
VMMMMMMMIEIQGKAMQYNKGEDQWSSMLASFSTCGKS